MHESPGRAGTQQTFDTEKISMSLSSSHWVAQGFRFSTGDVYPPWTLLHEPQTLRQNQLA